MPSSRGRWPVLIATDDVPWGKGDRDRLAAADGGWASSARLGVDASCAISGMTTASPGCATHRRSIISEIDALASLEGWRRAPHSTRFLPRLFITATRTIQPSGRTDKTPAGHAAHPEGLRPGVPTARPPRTSVPRRGPCLLNPLGTSFRWGLPVRRADLARPSVLLSSRPPCASALRCIPGDPSSSDEVPPDLDRLGAILSGGALLATQGIGHHIPEVAPSIAVASDPSAPPVGSTSSLGLLRRAQIVLLPYAWGANDWGFSSARLTGRTVAFFICTFSSLCLLFRIHWNETREGHLVCTPRHSPRPRRLWAPPRRGPVEKRSTQAQSATGATCASGSNSVPLYSSDAARVGRISR